MKKLMNTFLAVVFLIGMLNNPLSAQNVNDNMSTTTTTDMDRDDDNDNWGLLGLIGLLGLLGLRKKDHAVTHSTTNTPKNL